MDDTWIFLSAIHKKPPGEIHVLYMKMSLNVLMNGLKVKLFFETMADFNPI